VPANERCNFRVVRTRKDHLSEYWRTSTSPITLPNRRWSPRPAPGTAPPGTCYTVGLYPRPWAYIARRVDCGHVEDTVSETMTRAVRGIDSCRPGPAAFDGWVFGIARRVCADYHRRRARLLRQDVVAAGMAEVIEDGRTPGDPAATEDDHAGLRRAFELHSPVTRRCWSCESSPGSR
jgi:Sigma-70 region 2